MKKFKAFFYVLSFALVAMGLLLPFQNCSRIKVVDPSQTNQPSIGQGSEATDMTIPDLITKNGEISLAVSPPLIDFGMLPLHTLNSQDLVVTNMGASDLKVSLPSQVGAFLLEASQCSELKTMQSCKVKVSFAAADNIPRSSQILVKAMLTKDGKEEQLSVPVKGQGFFLPPSAQDKLALVGWYSYKQPQKIAFDNSVAANSMCPAVVESAGHGQIAEFCYEPSGAHGLYNGDSQSGFSTLSNYILQTGSNFSSVPTLDQLFPTAADLRSDNICFGEGLFYYALGYLIVPASLNTEDSSWDVRFSLSNVDDALQLVTNGYRMGVVTLGQSAQFSLRTVGPSGQQALHNGANTVVALWLDDCRTDRYITDAKVQFKTLAQPSYQTFQPLTPNIIRGYIYDKTTGQAISGAEIKVVDSSNAIKTVNSDNSGFYSVTGVKDGNSTVTVNAAGKNTLTEVVATDHKSASTAIIDFSRGL
jgi:hypothetical protein